MLICLWGGRTLWLLENRAFSLSLCVFVKRWVDKLQLKRRACKDGGGGVVYSARGIREHYDDDEREREVKKRANGFRSGDAAERSAREARRGDARYKVTQCRNMLQIKRECYPARGCRCLLSLCLSARLRRVSSASLAFIRIIFVTFPSLYLLLLKPTPPPPLS